jgi:two-component system, LytTR family, response regulator
MIKVLVVDDEPLARRGVRVCLRAAKDMTVVGEACSGPDALEKIAALSPDLVFLDVQMPGMDGFDMLAQLRPAATPLIVFLTAHDDYALQAFAAHALDYVMKPIDDARFAAALDNVRRRWHDRQAGEQMAHIRHLLADRPGAEQAGGHVVVRSGHRTRLLDHAEIDWIEAAGDYATLHAGKRSFMIRTTMDALEQRLDPSAFVRIHRSTIVAVDRLSGFSLLPSRDALVQLKDGTELRASRRYRHRLAFR